MAGAAHCDVMHLGRFAAWNVVRIVAGQAGHLGLTKAGRLAKAISCSGDFESIDTRAGLLVEMQRVISERFARPIRKYTATVATNRVGKGTAGRLEMALHTDFHLAIPVQLGGIYDGPANVLNFGMPGFE